MLTSQGKVSCSCKKFEFAGILCSHALKVLSLKNILKIPELYIMKRWTKKAKKNIIEAQSSGVCVEPFGSTNEKDEQKMIGVRYREICHLNNLLATRAPLTAETFTIARDVLLKVIEEIDANLENMQTVKPTLGPQSVVRKIISSSAVAKQTSASPVCQNQSLLSRVEEKERDGASSGTKKVLHEDEGANDIVIKGLKKKVNKSVRSGKRPIEQSIRKRKQKMNKLTSSNNAIPTTENNNQMLSTNQEYRAGTTNLNMAYPSEATQISHVEAIRFPQIFNPIVDQRFNFAPCYFGNQQRETSLTQLLQQQLTKPQGFERFNFNSSIAEEKQKKDDGNSGDMHEE